MYSERFFGAFYFWLSSHTRIFLEQKGEEITCNYEAAFKYLSSIYYILDGKEKVFNNEEVSKIQETDEFNVFLNDISKRAEFIQMRDMKEYIEKIKTSNEKMDKFKDMELNIPNDDNELKKFVEDLNSRFDDVYKNLNDKAADSLSANVNDNINIKEDKAADVSINIDNIVDGDDNTADNTVDNAADNAVDNTVDNTADNAADDKK